MTLDLTNQKVAVLGTSLVLQDQWTAPFAAKTGCQIINLGFSGGTFGLPNPITDNRQGKCTDQMTEANIPEDVAYIIVDNPVNDPAQKVPLGALGDTTTATFAGAMTNVSAWATTHRPNAKVVYVSLTSSAPTFAHGPYYHGAVGLLAPLTAYQSTLKAVVENEGRLFVDLNKAGVNRRTIASLTSDGLHWNAAGGVLVADAIIEALGAGLSDAPLVPAGSGFNTTLRSPSSILRDNGKKLSVGSVTWVGAKGENLQPGDYSYFEARLTQLGQPDHTYVGLSDASDAVVGDWAYPGSMSESVGIRGIYGGKHTPFAFSVGTAVPGFSPKAGDVIRVASNRVNGSVWFGINDTWFGGHIPSVTDDDGRAYSYAPGLMLRPFIGVAHPTNEVHLLTSPSEFVYGPPPGFSPWL
jgi:lysophospholipase L1-like esterase